MDNCCVRRGLRNRSVSLGLQLRRDGI